MNTEMNRREFLGAILPVAGHARTLSGYRRQALSVIKWTLVAACVWILLQMVAGIPFEGWSTLGGLFLKFVVPVAMGLWLLSRLLAWIDASGNAVLQRLTHAFGRVAVLASMIVCGAVLYDFWKRKPADALIAVLVFAIVEFRRGWLEKSQERTRPEEVSPVLKRAADQPPSAKGTI